MELHTSRILIGMQHTSEKCFSPSHIPKTLLKIFMWAWYCHQWPWLTLRVFWISRHLWGSGFDKYLQNGPNLITQTPIQWIDQLFFQVVHYQCIRFFFISQFNTWVTPKEGMFAPDENLFLPLLLYILTSRLSMVLGFHSWKLFNILPLPSLFSTSHIQGAVHDNLPGFLGLIFFRKIALTKTLRHRQSKQT